MINIIILIYIDYQLIIIYFYLEKDEYNDMQWLPRTPIIEILTI
jgi:hypothetical protein